MYAALNREYIMTCECKDENGSFLDRCLGTCLPAKRLQQVMQSGEVRFEVMENKLNKIISLLENKIDYSSGCSYDERFMYQKAFKDGFELAREIYE
jgi:hypothetical protein